MPTYIASAISDTLLAQLNANPDISHIQEFITKPGIIKNDEDFMGVVLKGVSKQYDLQFFRKNLLEGSVQCNCSALLFCPGAAADTQT